MKKMFSANFVPFSKKRYVLYHEYLQKKSKLYHSDTYYVGRGNYIADSIFGINKKYNDIDDPTGFDEWKDGN